MVATNIPPHGIPVSDNILGFTNIMYAIVKKVVTPAIISVLTFVPFSFNLNIKSPFY